MFILLAAYTVAGIFLPAAKPTGLRTQRVVVVLIKTSWHLRWVHHPNFLRLFFFLPCATLHFPYSKGAFYFYWRERPLEEHRRTVAENKRADIEDASKYIVDRMLYISYGDDVTGEGKFNNCSVWIQDPFYVAEQGR